MPAIQFTFTLRWVALLCATLLVGCAPSLHTYPDMTDEDSLRLIAERLESVKTLSASADLTLTDANEQTVSMDGAVVARSPTHARLRAWKFGTPAMDITILPEGVWIFAVGRDGSSTSDVSGIPTKGVSHAIEILSGTYFARARTVEEASTRKLLVVSGPTPDGTPVLCEIDRSTLTPRRFILQTDGGVLELLLSRYEHIGNIAWPKRLDFRAPNGAITVRFSDVELNEELSDLAFNPPSRAVRQP